MQIIQKYYVYVAVSAMIALFVVACSTTQKSMVSDDEYMDVIVSEQFMNEEFEKPDSWAKYPGGEHNLNRHIMMNIRIPEEARREGYAGRVIISYEVDAQGVAGDVEALMSPHHTITEMYEDIITTLEPWKPAIRNGEPVSQKYYIVALFRDGNIEEE